MLHLNERTLDDLLAGRISATRMSRIRKHVEGCRACARRLEEWRDNFEPISQLFPPVFDRSMSAVPEAIGPLVLVPEPEPRRFRLEPSTVLWSLAVIGALVVGYFASRMEGLPWNKTPTRPGGVVELGPLALRRDSGAALPGSSATATARQPALPSPLQAGGDTSTASGARAALPPPIPPASADSTRAESSRSTPRDTAATRAAAAPPAATPARERTAPPAPDTVDESAPAEPEAPATSNAAFRRITFAEALRRFKGTVRTMDGLKLERVEIGPGRLVPGAQPNADLLRLTYRNVDGTRIILDQQQILPDASGFRPVSDPRLESGDTAYNSLHTGANVATWLDPRSYQISLTVLATPDSLKKLISRVH